MLALLALLLPAPGRAGDAERARAAAAHLRQIQLPSGLFAYDHDFLLGGPTGGDGLVRQAGGTAALGMYYLHTRDEASGAALAAALERLAADSIPIRRGALQTALEALRLLSLPAGRIKLRRALESYGLLYQPTGEGRVVAVGGDYARADTGATALALLAELHYRAASGDDRFAQIRNAWLRGLLALRVPGGGFRSKPTQIEESSYYNGEGWLALAFWASQELAAPPELQETLSELDDYALAFYAGRSHRGFYHWGAQASALRYRTTRERRFAEFAADQAHHYLADSAEPNPQNTCAAIEGLASAHSTLRSSDWPDAELRQRIAAHITREMSKNRRLQLQPGQRRIDYEGGAELIAPDLSHFPGAFLAATNSPLIRVDITQHCLSALLKLPSEGLDEAD